MDELSEFSYPIGTWLVDEDLNSWITKEVTYFTCKKCLSSKYPDKNLYCEKCIKDIRDQKIDDILDV